MRCQQMVASFGDIIGTSQTDRANTKNALPTGGRLFLFLGRSAERETLQRTRQRHIDETLSPWFRKHSNHCCASLRRRDPHSRAPQPRSSSPPRPGRPLPPWVPRAAKRALRSRRLALVWPGSVTAATRGAAGPQRRRQRWPGPLASTWSLSAGNRRAALNGSTAP